MRAQRRTIDEIKKKKKWRTIITIQKQVTIPSKSYLSFDSSNLFLRLSRNSIRLVPNVIFLSDDSLQLKKKKTLVSNCTFPFLEVRSSVAIGYSFVQKTRKRGKIFSMEGVQDSIEFERGSATTGHHGN